MLNLVQKIRYRIHHNVEILLKMDFSFVEFISYCLSKATHVSTLINIVSMVTKLEKFHPRQDKPIMDIYRLLDARHNVSEKNTLHYPEIKSNWRSM